MKISYWSLPFQMTKSEFEVIRKHSKARISEYDQLHAHLDCVCVCVCVDLCDHTHQMTNPTTI